MTQDGTERLLTRLVEFYDVELGEEQAREYLRVLGEYPGEVAEQAVSDAIDKFHHFPKPRELRELLGRRMHSHQTDEATRQKLAELEDLERLAERETPPEVYTLLREMAERMSMNKTLNRGERTRAKLEVRKWAEKEREAAQCQDSSPAT